MKIKEAGVTVESACHPGAATFPTRMAENLKDELVASNGYQAFTLPIQSA